MNMKPILFTDEMVRAILAGRKTQTRRFGTRYGTAPYAVGDRLYVRETWAPFGRFAGGETLYWYRADYPDWPNEKPEGWDDKHDHWRPSIHMPKDAARIFLEAVNVYRQEPQIISEAEAVAEGVTPRRGETARDAFLRLWCDLYGVHTCNSRNVWAIEFKVLEVRK